MNLFGKKAFDYPKPLNLIKYLLKIPFGKEITILDFLPVQEQLRRQLWN